MFVVSISGVPGRRGKIASSMFLLPTWSGYALAILCWAMDASFSQNLIDPGFEAVIYGFIGKSWELLGFSGALIGGKKSSMLFQ